MRHPDQAAVTGAFSYPGGYVARRLLDQGVRVRTLTRRPHSEDPLPAMLRRPLWTSPTLMDCAGRCREQAFSTTPTGFGTPMAG